MSAFTRAGLAVVLTLGLAACGDAPEQAESDAYGEPGATETQPVPAWVGEVAVVANAIEARPSAVDSILEAHEMTRATLDSLLYEVAEDPALTAAYREARDR
ncbi:MAG: hypothetical protein ACN0LA_11305 [Candidatus Longimicrobiales bacterium M2_2A_002]